MVKTLSNGICYNTESIKENIKRYKWLFKNTTIEKDKPYYARKLKEERSLLKKVKEYKND